MPPLSNPPANRPNRLVERTSQARILSPNQPSIRQELLECGGSATAFDQFPQSPKRSARRAVTRNRHPSNPPWAVIRGAQRRRISLRSRRPRASPSAQASLLPSITTLLGPDYG